MFFRPSLCLSVIMCYTGNLFRIYFVFVDLFIMLRIILILKVRIWTFKFILRDRSYRDAVRLLPIKHLQFMSAKRPQVFTCFTSHWMYMIISLLWMFVKPMHDHFWKCNLRTLCNICFRISLKDLSLYAVWCDGDFFSWFNGIGKTSAPIGRSAGTNQPTDQPKN